MSLMTKAQLLQQPDPWAIVYNLTPKPEPKPVVETKPIIAPGGTNNG